MGVPPDRMGPYELVRKLGRGGMAETFLARRRGPHGFEQECCLKCVLAPFADDPDFRDQFLDEATLHGRLTHGNIVRVEDFGEHDGTLFLVMELVDGCDLAQLLEHSRSVGETLPTALSVLIATDLCQALRYAHDLETESGPMQIVHRDLTPSNVLISRAGEVKLSDFGIARAAQRRHRTQTGYTKGKFCYMSPEQIEAARDLDGRSDLFALGCLLYEMLAGRRAFEATGGNDLSVLPRILEGNFTPLTEQRPDLDAALTGTVDGLLQRARDDRPEHAREVLMALAPFAPRVTGREQLASLVERVAGPRRPSRPTGTLASEDGIDLEGPTRAAYYAEPTQTRPLRPTAQDSAGGDTTRVAASRTWKPSTLGSALVLLGASATVWGTSGWVVRERDDIAARASSVVPSSAPASDAAGASRVVAPSAAGDPLDREAAVGPVRPVRPGEHAPAAPSASGTVDVTTRAPQPVLEAAAASDENDPDDVDLRVVVIPYGNIWIDGKRRGSTRARLTLPAGAHRIGIGRGQEPTQQEEVTLRPGRRTLEYELDGTFH